MTLDAGVLRARLAGPDGPYRSVSVVATTGSTNADLVNAAGSTADGTLLLAEEQTAGKGRRSRQWASPPGSGLYGSVLLRPVGVPAARLGTLTLLAGVAVVETCREAGVPGAVLKWPNDVLDGGGKLAGILAEAVTTGGNGTAVVVGIGLNVTPLPVDVPPGAGALRPASLSEGGATVTDRTELAVVLWTRLAEQERAWRAAGGDMVSTALLDRYRRYCATIGQRVRVELPAGAVEGTARDIDGGGQLILDTADGTRVISAGDVVVLRRSTSR